MGKQNSTIGARSPLTPGKFSKTAPTAAPLGPTPPDPLDDGADYWWSGIAQYGAAVALAAVVTLAPQQFGFEQNETLAHRDEDYWTQPAPVQPGPTLVQQWPFEQNDIPTPVAVFHPDEDYWSVTVPSVASPQVLPFVEADDFVPTVAPGGTIVAEEDGPVFSQVAPVSNFLFAFNQDELITHGPQFIVFIVT